jgi:hypothetical protein
MKKIFILRRKKFGRIDPWFKFQILKHAERLKLHKIQAGKTKKIILFFVGGLSCRRIVCRRIAGRRIVGIRTSPSWI